MSFTGDLEHLPIVDVIQLLHATRKSGILRVGCRKGESQLIFKDGFIVSANHLNNRVRIGEILIDLGLITNEILDQALKDQKEAGHNRRPLIITLIEKGLVKESDAYKGLEQLIEMTVVEILTWKGGTFTLDVMPQSVDDEYRYFPEKMNRELNVDTQGILMNALRIFDEKMRDGQLQEDDTCEEAFALEVPSREEETPILSADDLGLAEMDQLESKLPEVYSVLDDRELGLSHLHRLDNLAHDLSTEEIKLLADFLGGFPCSQDRGEAMAKTDGQSENILFFSSDELLSYCLTAVCRDAGMSVIATNEELALGHLMDRFHADRNLPILVLDSPNDDEEGFSVENMSRVRARERGKFQQLCMIQLTSANDALFAMRAYNDNIRAVLPRPSRKAGKDSFVADTIQFLLTLRSYLRSCVVERELCNIGRLSESFSELRRIGGASEAAFVLLKLVADLLERSVTLIVREQEMIAEKGIGIKDEKGKGIIPSMGFRFPLSKPSLFQDVIEKGEVFYGNVDDPMLRQYLFSLIGAPVKSSVLMLPLRYHGKTISITYGDFGAKEPVAVDVGLLQILADHAEVALENSIYRKRMEKTVAKG